MTLEKPAQNSPGSNAPQSGQASEHQANPLLGSDLSHSHDAETIARMQSGTFDLSGMTPDEIKREFDIFRDVLGNVNNTLRFQIQLSVTLLAACVTVLNIVPPQEHSALLNDLDRWVFLPALASMGVGYHGLEHHWYSSRKHFKLDSDIKQLYQLVRYKHRMVKIALALQGFGLTLMMVFVLLEYK